MRKDSFTIARCRVSTVDWIELLAGWCCLCGANFLPLLLRITFVDCRSYGEP